LVLLVEKQPKLEQTSAIGIQTKQCQSPQP